MRTTKIIQTIGILIGMTINAYGDENNAPRQGDRVLFRHLTAEPAWTDSAKSSPDLTSSVTDRSARLQVFPSAPSDSLSTLCIIFSRIIMNVGERNGRLCHISDFIPGDTRKYQIPYPLNFAVEAGENHPVSSTGIISEGDSYVTSGMTTGNITYGHTLTTGPDKKIRNVRCIQSITVDTFRFTQAEPFLHIGTVREWYAPGYRYPLLRMQHDSISSLSGEPIDATTTWYMTLPDEQEDSVTDDPVNEALRNAIRESDSNRFIPVGNKPDNNGGNNPHTPSVIEKDRNLIVTSSPDSAGITELLLCDISGKVYSYQTFTVGTTEVTVTKEGLLPGLYLLHISTGSDTVTYKFNL